MLNFHLYGFFIGLGIIVGLEVANLLDRRLSVYKVFPWVFISGLLGARLYHLVDYWWYYSKNPIQILYLWQGGLAIFGAIAGGFIGLWIFYSLKLKKQKINFLSLLDLAAFGLPIGQAIGRLGNYFNQELYGLPTQLPWAIYIKPANRLPGFESFSHFHPLFAYEALGSLLIFTILITLRKTIKKPKPGIFFLFYLAFYSFLRFWLEFLRINPWRVGNINVAQAISLGLLLLSITGLICYHTAICITQRSTKQSES